MIRTLSIIFTTGTGHTEFVVDTVISALATTCPDIRIIKQRAESSQPEDMTKSDALILACGTWNTNNVEGQPSPYMFDLLARSAKQELQGIPAAVIGLGDERYFFKARAADKLTEYLTAHHATIILPALKILNEPFEQAAKILAWSKELSNALSKLPTRSTT